MENPISAEKWNQLGVSRESLTRLEKLVSLVLTWQKHINLIAPSTEADIWQRHILDSAQLLALMPQDVSAIADLGSGGGFPSLVLAAVHSAKVHMYESNTKKAAFLQEALRHMGVSGVVHRERLELRSAPALAPKVQVVTARAFAPLHELLGYAAPFMRDGALGLFHKGQDVDAEIQMAARSWHMDYEKHASLTDSKAVILAVSSLKPIGGDRR